MSATDNTPASVPAPPPPCPTRHGIILTEKAPKPIGPYSQAIEVKPLLFVSGQIPLDPVSGAVVAGGFEAQAETALANLREVLAAAGLSFANLVKTTVFLRNMSDFSCFNLVYERTMNGAAPARSVVEVSSLPRGVLVEIEAIACR
ncbi:MAG: Rid family detoxifying hydrolase [Chitinispirillales bacterium]|nr:Rid family detoxifying hydrolase [Chitinispirillales bacterium]